MPAPYWHATPARAPRVPSAPRSSASPDPQLLVAPDFEMGRGRAPIDSQRGHLEGVLVEQQLPRWDVRERRGVAARVDATGDLHRNHLPRLDRDLVELLGGRVEDHVAE